MGNFYKAFLYPFTQKIPCVLQSKDILITCLSFHLEQLLILSLTFVTLTITGQLFWRSPSVGGCLVFPGDSTQVVYLGLEYHRSAAMLSLCTPVVAHDVYSSGAGWVAFDHLIRVESAHFSTIKLFLLPLSLVFSGEILFLNSFILFFLY